MQHRFRWIGGGGQNRRRQRHPRHSFAESFAI